MNLIGALLFVVLVLCALFILFFCFLCFFKVEHHTVDAIAKACWWGAVVKHMAQVRFTTATRYLGPLHTVCVIRRIDNTPFTYGLIKTWPTTPTFKFGITFKKRIAAHRTIVGSYF